MSRNGRYCECGRLALTKIQGRYIYAADPDLCLKCYQAHRDRIRCIETNLPPSTPAAARC
jgi:hypothetical protein